MAPTVSPPLASANEALQSRLKFLDRDRNVFDHTPIKQGAGNRSGAFSLGLAELPQDDPLEACQAVARIGDVIGHEHKLASLVRTSEPSDAFVPTH